MNSALPIEAVLPELCAALAERDEVVLQAPPGAGKTTQVPLALLQQPWLEQQRIVMLEPRRLAARNAAERLAQQLGEKVGETVGYRMRFDHCVGPKTRIEVVTEGVFLRRLQDDPELGDVGLVIFDEFHERSLDADLSLALTLNARSWLRDTPLKVLLMSATLDGDRLSRWLNDAPCVRSEGRQYPVEVKWGKPLARHERLEERVTQQVLQALHEESGSVLVFLPGQGEIRRVQSALEEALGEQAQTLICPLHGDLDLAAQRQAIAPVAQGQCKVVLATNIAEASLTINGVRVVVDSGYERVPQFDPVTGMTRLATRRISKASATQRMGRAGRMEAGVCYRLWSEDQHDSLTAFAVPEIRQADLSPLVLHLARWGVEPSDLEWLDAPAGAAYQQGKTLLTQLGAFNGAQLSVHGQAMAELPVHPRLAHLLLWGQQWQQASLACRLAALLSERSRSDAPDLTDRLPLTQQGRLQQVAQQYARLLKTTLQPLNAGDTEQWAGPLLARAYPDRIARQRRSGGLAYRLANGRSAQWLDHNGLQAQEWLVVAELGSQTQQAEERIYAAVALEPDVFTTHLADLVSLHDSLAWDEQQQAFAAERQHRVGQLVWRQEALPELDEQTRSAALMDVVRRQGLNVLPWTPALRQWQARVMQARQLANEDDNPWPAIDDESLLGTLEDWLMPYVGKVTRLAHFAQLDLTAILHAQLPWPLPQQLDQHFPSKIVVPSGSSIAIDYLENPPVLAVRLQELFGLADTPHLGQGKLPLKLHLLSPARRPVQVTQDLASFWRNTYAEVKKDLKGRYPKHYWPDDPLIAEPTARAKPRK